MDESFLKWCAVRILFDTRVPPGYLVAVSHHKREDGTPYLHVQATRTDPPCLSPPDLFPTANSKETP